MRPWPNGKPEACSGRGSLPLMFLEAPPGRETTGWEAALSLASLALHPTVAPGSPLPIES